MRSLSVLPVQTSAIYAQTKHWSSELLSADENRTTSPQKSINCSNESIMPKFATEISTSQYHNDNQAPQTVKTDADA